MSEENPNLSTKRTLKSANVSQKNVGPKDIDPSAPSIKRVSKKPSGNGMVRNIAIGVIGIIGLLTLVSSYTVVESGNVGIVRTFGSVHSVELQPGLHFIRPFLDRVTQSPTRLKGYTVKSNAQSKDLQNISCEVTVQHSPVGDLSAEMFQEIGDLEKVDAVVILPSINESLKAIIAHYTAEELIILREEVKGKVVENIRLFIADTLKKKGIINALAIHNVAITDFDFSDDFNHSIEDKVKAEQDAHRAENEKTRRQTEAEAAQTVRQRAADAEAYYISKVSAARAEAIKRESTALSLNASLVDLRAAEKWNGKMPKYTNGGELPFVDGPTNKLPVPNQTK